MEDLQGMDVPITQLRPMRERTVSKRHFDRIEASVRSVGLLQPLLVSPEGEGYVIIDGVQRYKILQKMGVEIVPCVVRQTREAFTTNRMVNGLSPLQEHRMIERSLEELDEKTIASALGIEGIGHRLRKDLITRLHPDVAAAFDQRKLSRACAREMTHVTPARQAEVLAVMDGYKDYSIAFARSQILKTPPAQRQTRKHCRSTPWDRKTKRKSDMLKKLADAEQKHDFYSRLYKQYTFDLLRLAIYARSLLSNIRVREYLDRCHPASVARIESIIADAGAST